MRGRTVIPAKLLELRCQDRVVATGFSHQGSRIVQPELFRDTAKHGEHADDSTEPVTPFLRWGCQAVDQPGMTENSDEDLGRVNLAVLLVADAVTAVVDHGDAGGQEVVVQVQAALFTAQLFLGSIELLVKGGTPHGRHTVLACFGAIEVVAFLHCSCFSCH